MSDDDSSIENAWGEDPDWVEDNAADETQESGDLAHGAQHVMILIDTRPSMFIPSMTSDLDLSKAKISPFQAAIQACEDVLRNKVKNVAVHKMGRRDGVGVLLFGRDNNSNSVSTLLSLEPPGVDQVKQIRNYSEKELTDMEEASAICPLRDAIFQASKCFQNAKCVKKPSPSDKSPPDAKSVWIFTDTDVDEEQREFIEKTARDNVENGLELHLYPMGQSFATDFWNDILSSPLVMFEDMSNLLEKIHRAYRKERHAFSIPLLLPDWRDSPEYPGIMVDFYRPVHTQRKPTAVMIHQQSKRVPEKVTRVLDNATGAILISSRDPKEEQRRLEQARIRTFVPFGGREAEITKDELASIKQQSNATKEGSLVLLGFKPKDAIPLHYTVENSYFLYPNDDKAMGSKSAFANLHASMIRKGVVAIGELLTRKTATSSLVAIFAQDEESTDDGLQVTPPGMVVVLLPFEDDVRALDQSDVCTVTEESVQAAMKMVQAMSFGSDVSLDYFKNDNLVHFWNYVESIALDTDLPEPEQTLQVSKEDIRKVAGKEIDVFYAILPEDIVIKKATKRKIVADESGVDWVQAFQTDSLDECKVNTLKQYLRSVGENLSGRKTDLVERVSQSILARLAKGELQNCKELRAV